MILGLVSIIILKNCLAADKLGEFATGLAGNWLAASGEKFQAWLRGSGREILGKLADTPGRMPVNHDVALAERAAFGTALLAFHAALNAHDATFSPDERHWVTLLGNLAKDIGKASSGGKDDCALSYTQWIACLGKAFAGQELPNLLTGAHGVPKDALSRLFHSTFLSWLLDAVKASAPKSGSVAPGLVTAWLEDSKGFAFSPPDSSGIFKRLRKRVNVGGPLMKITLLDAWSQCFVEEIKLDPRAFTGLVLKYFNDIGTSLSIILERLDMSEQIINKAAESTFRIDRRIYHLIALTEDRFAMVVRRIRESHGLLTTLVSDVENQVALLKILGEAQEELLAEVNSLGAPPFSHNPKDQPEVITEAEPTIRQILVYRSQWLPFSYRDEELNRLFEFLNTEDPFSWWALVGEGGVGKSRLAFELVSKARDWGWVAGFLDPTFDLSSSSNLHQWKPAVDTLLVLDYATSQPRGPAQALSRMSENRAQFTGRLRVLLVARPASLSSLLNESRPDYDLQNENKRLARKQLFRGLPKSSLPSERDYVEKNDAFNLGRVAPARWFEFLLAVIRRAGASCVKLPDDWERDVENMADRGRPLLLTALGLHYHRTSGERVTGADINTLLDEVLGFEIGNRWFQVLRSLCSREQANGVTKRAWLLLPALQKFIAVVTLCQGASLTISGKAICDAIGLREDDESLIEAAAKLVLGVDARGRLRALEPALLAERFLVNGGYQPNDPPEGLRRLASLPFETVGYIRPASEIDFIRVLERLTSLNNDYPAVVSTWLPELFSGLKDDDLLHRSRLAVTRIKLSSLNRETNEIAHWAADLKSVIRSLPRSTLLRNSYGPLLAELRDAHARTPHAVTESAIGEFEAFLLL